jgi:acetoacetate decarboxylase
MPAVFGPSLLPDVSRVPEVHVVSVGFETTRDAAARLVPKYFAVPERAIMSLSRITYMGVDYLGGRPYSELLLMVNVVYDGADGTISGPYMPVLWVSDVNAILAGREFMGHAKLYGELPPIAETPTSRSFDCSEYGAPLVHAEAFNLQPIVGDSLGALRLSTAEAYALGWKYIPGADGTPDADYPTRLTMRWDYQRAWSGESRLEFLRPTATEAPVSSRIMSVLAELPVKQMRRSFVGSGSCEIDRAATTRLRA